MFDFYSQMGLHRKNKNVPILVVSSAVQKPQIPVLPLVQAEPATKKQNGGFKIISDVNNNNNNNKTVSKNIHSVQKVLPKNNQGGFKIIN